MKKRFLACMAIFLSVGVTTPVMASMIDVKPMELSTTTIVTAAYVEQQVLLQQQQEQAALIAEQEHQQVLLEQERQANAIQYVAIGNSLTCNDVCDYWWSTCGMAASEPSKDYVHLVQNWVSNQTGRNVTVETVSVKPWEMPDDGNRSVHLGDFDAYLNADTDIVTIQCGENITDYKGSLEQDMSDLFAHVRILAPNAEIIVLPNLLWDFADVEQAKDIAVASDQLIMADVGDYKQNYDVLYKSSIGTLVLGDDGNTHDIWYDCVAAHPNDAGMQKIADGICNVINLNDFEK